MAALALGATLAGSRAIAVEPLDPHSNADPSRFLVRHMALDLDVDFVARQLRGAVALTIERVAPSAEHLVLDTRDLEIRSVAMRNAAGDFLPLEYRLGASDPIKGRALEIVLPANPTSRVTGTAAAQVNEEESAMPPAARPLLVRIEYATSPEAMALQWLAPTQTRGRSEPFLYTQSQPVYARSWIPIQDSPGIRFTYEARIRAPKGLRVLMSAINDPQAPRTGEWHFRMPEPVPAYLVALAVGDLQFRAIGPRTGLYAEPATIDAATQEFRDLEAMLARAEERFGPYRWGRYDLLIMPPSFPFGGMENPRLSFITPTVIAGDRSLVSMITHELAHAWSGNLVTNADWGDFWLNEGITTYLERRILEDLYGPRLATMELALGRQYLDEEISGLVARGRVADTALALDLRGRDPDDALTDIAYEKGSLFLQFLEAGVGRTALDAFLSKYFADFAFRDVTTTAFESYLRIQLLAHHPGVITEAELQKWLYGTGLPDMVPALADDPFAALDRQRDAWLAGRTPTVQLPVAGWSPQEWMRFLDMLPDDLTDEQLAELQALGALDRTGNSEVLRSWLLLAVRNGYRPADARLETFLIGTGRHKMVQRLYEELGQSVTGAALGCGIYLRARPGYHPTTRKMVEALLPDCSVR